MEKMPEDASTTGHQGDRFNRYLFLALFLPVAAVVVVLGISFASLRSESQINEIIDRDSSRLHLISGFVGAEVLDSLQHLRSLSVEATTLRALDSGAPGDLRSLESSFLTLARRNPHYQQVRWIDESGIEKVRITRDQGTPYAVAPQDLQDKSSRYYFEAANALLPGELYISRIDLNEEHGQIETPPRPMLRIATPVEDGSRKRRGIIIINIDTKYLFNLLRAPGQSELEVDYSLVNKQGTLLSSEIGNLQTIDERDQSVKFFLLHPKVWERVTARNSGSLELDDGLWSWKALSPVDTFKNMARVFPQFMVAFDQLITDDFSLTLVAHRPPGVLANLRRENRMLISLIVVFGLSVYGLSLLFYLSSHARARRAEANAAYALARASNMERMKELEERFHCLVDASTIGQLVVDGNGRIEITNPAAERLLGYEKGELEGFLVDALLPASLQQEHARQRELYMQAPDARRMGVGRELEAVRKDGTKIPVEIGLTPYTDHGRQLVLASIVDLSQRKNGKQVSEHI
ncbi:MAG: PAS domain S-box protein [Gammaproteobacteria bacterium]